MIVHSASFRELKEQNQPLFDFAILCCQAVPALKGYMKAVEANAAPKLPDKDHFKGPSDFKQLRDYASKYKKTLGRLVFLSSFSYFEAYFKALIEEVLAFHGGHEALVAQALRRQHSHLAACNADGLCDAARRLREYKKPNWKPSYRKNISILEKTNFRFPSELFSTFGIIELNNYRDLKASQIPHVAKWCFGVPITDDEDRKFSQYRDIRNGIAHGTLSELDLTRGLEASRFLRELSIKVDQHVVKHFFVIETA